MKDNFYTNSNLIMVYVSCVGSSEGKTFATFKLEVVKNVWLQTFKIFDSAFANTFKTVVYTIDT